MSSPIKLAEIGNIVGDPARAAMLCALLDGRSHSATELSLAARVSRPTASWHLAKLADGQLVTAEKRGRSRHFQLASSLVAQALEAMMTLTASRAPRPLVLSRHERALRHARTCYDHFAGRLGVALTEALAQRKLILVSDDGGVMTRQGQRVLAAFGVDLSAAQRSRRAFCRPCLDWSEQRPHLAGAIGAALARRCFDLDWVRRLPDTRAVAITPDGVIGFEEQFGIIA